MPASVANFGLSAPLLIDSHASSNAWQEGATFADAAAVAAAADRLGYHHLSCGEHIGVPSSEAARRGVRYYDPLATFGYFSAITTQIRFATAVLVLGYHHPLEIAKRYGTLDVVSGGRLILGVGVGSLKQEFDVLGLGGQEFTERGARGDDALRALRASLGKREPAYSGPYYDFSGLVVDPHAQQDRVPLWIGGRSQRSLRRAIMLGDGWLPFGLSLEQFGEMIGRARETEAWQTREHPLEIVLPTPGGIDPIGEPQKTVDFLNSLLDVGATKLTLSFHTRSSAHFIEQLECLAAMEI